MSFLNNKKIKYGSVAVLLTVLILAVVLVMNIFVTMFSDHFGWYADTSSSGLFGFSDTSLSLLDKIDKENNEIHIYYFSDKNTLEQSQYGNYVLTLTNDLTTRYADDEFVTVHYIDDVNKDIFEIGAIFGDKYRLELERLYDSKEIAPGTMVIRNNTKEMDVDGSFVPDSEDYRVDVFSITDMYSETSLSFVGDYVLTARILGICQLAPTVYMMTGHDEMTVDEDGTYGNAEYLVNLFDSCGYNVKKLYLSQADFSTGRADNSIAVIFAPRIDYTKAEIEKLSRFVEKGGHLMMFADSVYRKLDNLTEFLSRYGITVGQDKFKGDLSSSLSLGDYTFVCEIQKLHDVMDKIAATTKTVVVSDARVLEIDSAKGASAILLPPNSATLNNSGDEAKGNEVVAAYSAGESRGSVFVCGSASLASSLIYTPSYTNRDVLLSVMDEMGGKNLPINVEIKTLATDGLDLTRGEAITLSVVVSCIPALLIVAVGTFVYVRRKNS
ncbi:MAG: Gldg family protein [Clostridia bacterium]|nr:Gldg family protein [Clostridia bacterium]